jgi:hypothetical protein
MQTDGRKIPIRRNCCEQLVELLEWIGLQAVEIRVQFVPYGGEAGWSADGPRVLSLTGWDAEL